MGINTTDDGKGKKWSISVAMKQFFFYFKLFRSCIVWPSSADGSCVQEHITVGNAYKQIHSWQNFICFDEVLEGVPTKACQCVSSEHNWAAVSCSFHPHHFLKPGQFQRGEEVRSAMAVLFEPSVWGGPDVSGMSRDCFPLMLNTTLPASPRHISPFPVGLQYMLV